MRGAASPVEKPGATPQGAVHLEAVVYSRRHVSKGNDSASRIGHAARAILQGLEHFGRPLTHRPSLWSDAAAFGA